MNIYSKLNLNPLAKAVSASLLYSIAFNSYSDDIEQIEVSVSRIQSTINEIPASISVINKEEIQKLAPNKLSDLLRYQAGITVEKSGDRHGDANINIRGIGGNRVLIVKDGIVMPEGFGSAGTSQGRGNFDPFNLQQVEILKGPASALYGSNALGGVVLMTSADPESLLEQSNGKARQSVNAGYFSQDERYRVGVSAAGKVAGGSALVQLQHQDFKESDINSDFDSNPKEGDSNSVLLKWKYRPSDNQIIDLIADYFKQEADNTLNTNIGPIKGPPGSKVTLSTANDQSSVFRAGIKHQIFDLGFADKVQWQIDYQKSNYKQFEQEQVQAPNLSQLSEFTRNTIEFEWEEFKQEQIGLNLLVEKEINEHHILVGIDLINKTLSRPTYIEQKDLISGTSTNVINGYSYPGKSFPDADITQYGAFFQDHFQFTDNVKLVAGIRYDYFENKPDPDEAYQNFNRANAITETFSDDSISPHLGLVWNISEQTSVFSNYSTGFRAPPIAQQYKSKSILIPVPGVPHEIVPNNDLSSEESRGIELGLRWNNQVGSIEVSAYDNLYKDFIDSKTIGYREAPPVFTGKTAIRQIQYKNVSEVSIKGLELAANLILDDYLPRGFSGDLKSAISIIDGENKLDGSGLNSVAPNSAVIGFAIRPNEQWQFDWHIRGVSKADDAEPLTRHGKPLPAFEPAGYLVQDLALRYAPNNELSLSLGIYNAFDKKYWESHNKGRDAAGELDATAASGRNLSLNANYSF